MTRQIEQALIEAKAVLIRQKKHLVYRFPSGKTVVISKSASDHRAEQNILRDIRRACF